MVLWSSKWVASSFLLSCGLRYLLYAVWPLDIQREGPGGRMSGCLHHMSCFEEDHNAKGWCWQELLVSSV